MANVITRAGNNAPLTNDQLDGNFTALNSAKLETSAVGTTVLAYDANLQTFVSAFTLPTTDGSAGQIVATDGSGVLSFVDNTSLPSQTGNAGKYLATDGSSAYWADVTGGSGGGGLANVAIDSQEYSATAGQTAFGVNYTDGYVLVYVNGVKLDPSEYTATSNTNITLSEGLALGDTVNLTGFSLTALSDVATSGAYGDLTGAPTALSAFTNDSGYITSYTVSESDVTAHQAALSLTKSQISDFGTYLTSETTTSLALSGNTLTYTDETGTATTIDLSAYLDEDSRAIASGTLNSTTGVVTFTRDDATTFTLDLSALLDDTNLVTSVAGKSGVVTLDADDISDSATKGVPTLTKQTNWDSAYGWGDHGAAGYLTSYTETDPVYTASSWYTTTNNATNWDSAYGWGDHSSAGYLTSYTVTESDVTAHQAALSITESQISDLGTYLTSYTETDPVFTAWDKSTGISITESQISDLQSYLTAVALNDVSDVDTATSAPSDGQALLWDATNTKWVPGTVSSGGGASTLIQLSDVYTSMSPTDGQVLTYDSTNGWQAEDAPTGGGGGGGLTFIAKTANYTASSGQGILADTSGGAFTVTLPASPSTGDQVVVADSGNSFATNRLTVARNSSTIADSAEDLVLDINDVLVDFIYDGSTWQFYTQPRAVSSGGSATVEPIVYNLDTVSSALTIDSGENGFSVGNMTISTGGSVTIADGQKWLIADGNITSDVGVPASTGKAIAMSIVFGG
jgi:hypothetical protein